MILSIIKANAEIGRLEKELADLQSKLTQTEADKDAISKAAADDIAKSVEMAKAAEADMAKAAELVKAAEAIKADVEKIASQKALEIVAAQGVPAPSRTRRQSSPCANCVGLIAPSPPTRQANRFPQTKRDTTEQQPQHKHNLWLN